MDWVFFMQKTRIRTALLSLCMVALLLAAAWGLPALFALARGRAALPTDAPILRTVILDAGHGGMDGGAESVTGSLEKDLNLDLSKTLATLFRVCGYTVIETRTTDEMLGADTVGGSRKLRDLAARLQISRENPDALFLSIHMNKFPLAKYSGLQVYYTENHCESQTLARTVQSTVRTHLQPQNTREVKQSTSAIYLLHRMDAVGILVECGFLSNPEEAAALDRADYRTRLAVLLAASVMEHNNSKTSV